MTARNWNANIIECDQKGCRAETGIWDTYHECVDEALSKGWEITDTNDYCPRHRSDVEYPVLFFAVIR